MSNDTKERKHSNKEQFMQWVTVTLSFLLQWSCGESGRESKGPNGTKAEAAKKEQHGRGGKAKQQFGIRRLCVLCSEK
jgi:hypothetical protein